MKSVSQDEGKCWEKWYRTRKAHLLRLSGPPPKNLCADQLNLALGCRYAERLLENPRVFRYLSKNHSEELRKLQNLLGEFEKTCRVSVSLARIDHGSIKL
jgi:hypothetical protein